MSKGVKLKKEPEDKTNQGSGKNSVFQIKGGFSSPTSNTTDNCDKLDITPSIVWVSRDTATSPSTHHCQLAERKCANRHEPNNSKGDYCQPLNSVDGALSTQHRLRYSYNPSEEDLEASGSKDCNFSHVRYQPSQKVLENYAKFRTGTKSGEVAKYQLRDQKHCDKGDYSGREVSISAIEALDRSRHPRGRSSDERGGRYGATLKPCDIKPTSSKVMPLSDDSNLDEGYNDSLTSSLQKEKTSRRANKNRVTKRVPRSSIKTFSSQALSPENPEYHTAVTLSTSNPPAAVAAEANASKNCTCSRTDQRLKNCPSCLMERVASTKPSNPSEHSLQSRNFQSSHKFYTPASTSQPARDAVDRGAATWNVRSSCEPNRWSSPDRNEPVSRCQCSETSQLAHRKTTSTLHSEISLPCGNKLVRCKNTSCPRSSLCAYIARYIWPKLVKAFVTTVRYGFIICVYLVLLFFVRRYITLNVFAHLTVLFLNILLMFILVFTPENMYIYLFGQNE